MKGIILVGGKGSRLYPITKATHKQLLPVYDKPMIYYPLTTLLQAGIKDILIITTEKFEPVYKSMLGDGSDFGIKLSYTHETKSEGVAKALTIAQDFIGDDNATLLLGDNLFLGDISKEFREAIKNTEKTQNATIFAYEVPDPRRYGVIEQGKHGEVLSIEEKPSEPKSNLASIGAYVLPKGASKLVPDLKLSKRGEYEIVSLLQEYLKVNKLDYRVIPNKICKWEDAGTLDSLLSISNFVKQAQDQYSISLGNPYLTALSHNYITMEKFMDSMTKMHPADFAKNSVEILKKKKKEKMEQKQIRGSR